MLKFSTFLFTWIVFSTITMADGGQLIKNGEQPSIKTDVAGSVTEYKYAAYTVKTTAGDEGDQIVVLFENGEAFEFCEVDMNTYFYGLKGDVMFVISRGGMFPTLMGFHLVEMDMEPYEEFVIPEGRAEVDGSNLVVWRIQEWVAPEVEEALEEKYEKIEADDQMVYYARKVIYDYGSKELVETDQYDCVSADL